MTRMKGHMMTSSNWNIFRVTGPFAGNSPVTGEFPAQRPLTRSFDVFFDLGLNKRLSKQSRRWWFETPFCLSWRHCNAIAVAPGVTYLNESTPYSSYFMIPTLLQIHLRWYLRIRWSLACIKHIIWQKIKPTVEFMSWSLKQNYSCVGILWYIKQISTHVLS